VATLEALAPNQLKQQRPDALVLHKALEYLQNHGVIEAKYTPATTPHRIAVEQEWIMSK
jgi:hypothetical protein